MLNDEQFCARAAPEEATIVTRPIAAWTATRLIGELAANLAIAQVGELMQLAYLTPQISEPTSRNPKAAAYPRTPFAG